MSTSRTLTRKEKSDSLKRAKKEGLCRWCGLDVKRLSTKRRTFCSDECVHEFLLRSDAGYARKEVYKRDKGVCSQCGLNCSKWYADFKRWLRMMPLSVWNPVQKAVRDHAVDEFFLISGMEPVPDWQHRSTFWDMDHTVEVVKGGGQCDLSNLTTLCIPCHRAKTVALNKSRAKKP